MAGGRRLATYGDIRDVKHVVILMQENRSFDHYFGSLRGVRGFGDRATILLPGGLPVWRQPDGPPAEPVGGTQYPWPLRAGTHRGAPPPTPAHGAQHYGGTDHSWRTQHAAWHGGLLNAWQHAKGGPTTMGFLTRDDIPFYYALADAYTVGDAYHCSVFGPTGPNRTYLWSGTINAGREHGGHVAWGARDDELGSFLPWESYPETLQAAGVSWKVYQGSDNYGDNGAQYFAAVAKLDPAQGGTASPGDVYHDNGVAIVPEPHDPELGNADNLALAVRTDVLAGTLPRVSWVVTNQRFSEHPASAPADGAYLVGEVLRALAADPGVFGATLMIICYDENDGQFDHVPPPVPAAGTAGEFHLEPSIAPVPLPAGLGFRVPLLLVSPWTRGGWVTSEVADHTSVIQFIERWTTALGTPAICPNISAWRRGVCGDLTSALDFANPVYGLPDLPFVPAPDGQTREYHPVPPGNVMPVQEPGTKPARPVPCQPGASLAGVTASGGRLTARLTLSNSAPFVRRASHFAVYDNLAAAAPATFPGQFTVTGSAMDIGTGADTGEAVSFVAGAGPGYDITVIGPNRFLRRFTGDIRTPGATVRVTAAYHRQGREPTLTLTLANGGAAAVTFTITADNYASDAPVTRHVPAGESTDHHPGPLANGWYDLTVTIDGDPAWSQRFTGHLETGAASVTG